MPGYKNLTHKQEFNAQHKGHLTRQHLGTVINSGDPEEGLKSLKKKHAGNKGALRHLKGLEKDRSDAQWIHGG